MGTTILENPHLFFGFLAAYAIGVIPHKCDGLIEAMWNAARNRSATSSNSRRLDLPEKRGLMFFFLSMGRVLGQQQQEQQQEEEEEEEEEEKEQQQQQQQQQQQPKQNNLFCSSFFGCLCVFKKFWLDYQVFVQLMICWHNSWRQD